MQFRLENNLKTKFGSKSEFWTQACNFDSKIEFIVSKGNSARKCNFWDKHVSLTRKEQRIFHSKLKAENIISKHILSKNKYGTYYMGSKHEYGNFEDFYEFQRVIETSDDRNKLISAHLNWPGLEAWWLSVKVLLKSEGTWMG